MTDTAPPDSKPPPSSPPEAEAETVLVVDDDEVFRERLVRAFARRGLIATGVADGAAALAHARAESPEMVVVDLRMPNDHGLDIAKELLRIDPTTRVVILTGYGSIATAIEAIRLGAIHYLQKPADAAEILRALRGELSPDADRGAPRDPISPDAVPSLARVEWEHIERVMHDCDNNISKAARLLGLHRRSLQRKLAKMPTLR